MDSGAAATLFAALDRELWLVTAAASGRRSGLIATFVSSASIVSEMPRLLVGLARQHFTWELIEASGAFGIHLLREANIEWVWRFGMHSGRDSDKFTGLVTHAADTGSPLLEGTAGWMDCRVEARMDTGDRMVYLAEILAVEACAAGPPLTMRRLIELAPRDRLDELKRQLQEDSVIDAQAIHGFRQRQSR
jgi:flavin reductase (DIM6/NTAB) family NADH-FMN oxidoreductase RutF